MRVLALPWILIATVLVAAGACTEKKKPEPKAQTTEGEVAKVDPPTKVRRPEGVEKVEGYEVIRAKTKSGETAEIKVKPPEGWSIMRAPDGPDPHGGTFTLAEATAGMPGAPKDATLAAMIKTSMGSFYCDLYPKEAPNTVANFVGLARGKRTFWDRVQAEWVKRPYYDGTNFHRVIPGFMIQGGDHTGTGMGMIGYRIPDEVHPKLKHDRPGQLCMANRGPHTNEAQFFITEAPAPHLDGSYTIFGQCEPATLVQRIARVPQTGPPKNNPRTEVAIEKVEIRRVVGGAAKWMPESAKLPPLPNLPAPGRAVQVDSEGKPAGP